MRGEHSPFLMDWQAFMGESFLAGIVLKGSHKIKERRHGRSFLLPGCRPERDANDGLLLIITGFRREVRAGSKWTQNFFALTDVESACLSARQWTRIVPWITTAALQQTWVIQAGPLSDGEITW